MSELILWRNIEKIATITSVGELVNKLQEKQLRIDKSQEQLFYRGEPKDYLNTKLMPKVFRNDYVGKEYDYYYDILTNFPQEFENLSNLSRLSKMQYYFEVNNKEKVLNELDLLGINKSTIYCDIANRAEYLKNTKFK